jgi:hypothetical protein
VSLHVANMPQLCVVAYGCLEGIWLPTLGHCCLSSTAYIDGSHYLDIVNNNAVIINAHLCSHSEHCRVMPTHDYAILLHSKGEKLKTILLHFKSICHLS